MEKNPNLKESKCQNGAEEEGILRHGKKKLKLKKDIISWEAKTILYKETAERLMEGKSGGRRTFKNVILSM